MALEEMQRSKMSVSRSSLFSLSVIIVFLVICASSFEQSFAHNNSITIVPISRNSVNLDGVLADEEWADAYQQNLTSAGVPGNYTILYLKYDFSQKALAGAFDIADTTPSNIREKLDQIALQFDTLHDASPSLSSDDHIIVFTRTQNVEYYVGEPSSPLKIKSVTNSTLGQHMLILQNPFSRVDFNIMNSSSAKWTGEFKIYFQSEFKRANGFAMQQVDYHSASFSTHANFPILNRSLAYSPSTWGDIRVEDLSQILENIKEFCPSGGSNVPTSLEGNHILCITGLSRNQINENDSTHIIVSGRFANFINNSAASNEKIHINIIDPSNPNVPVWEEESDDSTRSDGSFSRRLSDISLQKGTYFVMAEPTSAQYNRINATAPLIVNEDVFTLDEAAGYIQLFLGIVGGMIAIAISFPALYKHLAERKKKSTLYDQLRRINDIYYDNPGRDREQHLVNLREKRDKILDLLDEGKIDKDQYKMLDDKISEYEQRINNNKLT
jgi:hypothetical protein